MTLPPPGDPQPKVREAGLDVAELDLHGGPGFWPEVRRLAEDSGLGPLVQEVLERGSPPRLWVIVDEPDRTATRAAAALAVARELMRRGQSVTVIDADDRHPDLTRWAGRFEQEGWIDILRYGASLAASSVPLPWEGRGGRLVGVGSYVPAGATDEEIERLLRRLRTMADDLVVSLPLLPESAPWLKAADVPLLCWDRHGRSAERTEQLAQLMAATAARPQVVAFGPADAQLTAAEAETPAAGGLDEAIRRAADPLGRWRREAAAEPKPAVEPGAAPAPEPEAAPAAAAPEPVRPETEPGPEPERPLEPRPEPSRAPERAPSPVPEVPALEPEAEPAVEPEAESAPEPAEVAASAAAATEAASPPPPVEEPWPVRPWPEPGRPRGARPFWIAAVALLIIAGVLGTWYLTVGRRTGPAPVATGAGAVAQRQTASPSPEQPEVALGQQPAAGREAIPQVSPPGASEPGAGAAGPAAAEPAGPEAGTSSSGAPAGTSNQAPAEPVPSGTAPATAAPPAPSPPAPPGLDAAPVAGTWALWVSSVPDSAAAGREIARLRPLGLRAVSRPIELPGRGRWWRIYVGSFAGRAEAEQAEPEVERRLRHEFAEPARF